MDPSPILATVREKFQALDPIMTERLRRRWAACEALALGRGGPALVSRATGLSRTTIWAGIRELRHGPRPGETPDPHRSRRPGGGRPMVEAHDPTLFRDLELLVDPATRGDPMPPLRWPLKRP